MYKLADLLMELVERKVIELPKEQESKIEDVYKYIKANINNLLTTAPQDSNKPLIVPKFRNYFGITPIGSEKIVVSVGLYNNPEDFAGGRGAQARDVLSKVDLARKHILINLAMFSRYSEQEFEELVRHELIHAIDPKTSQKHLYAKASSATAGDRTRYVKLSKNAAERYRRLFQRPEEFTAETGTMVATIKKNLEKIQDIKKRDEYKKLIIQLPQDLKNKEVEDVQQNSQYKKALPDILGTANENDLYNKLNVIQGWMENPEYSKKFLQIIANLVQKIK